MTRVPSLHNETEGLAARGAALLGGRLVRAEPMHGGDLSRIVEIALDDGHVALVKTGAAPRLEAAMLEAVAASGAPAPRVLAVGDDALVIERLPADGRLDSAWASLGAAVATLHGATGARYGWGDDFAFGTVAIVNEWSDDWPGFWAERRLRVHAPHVPAALARRVDALAGGLAGRLPARPRPALLHGDLWTGNVVAADGQVTGLIDPACYYGDREVDLAMLRLFGSPGAAFFDAYGALEPGHEARLPIYQLWPALVHVRLFGSGYHGMTDRLLTACGV